MARASDARRTLEIDLLMDFFFLFQCDSEGEDDKVSYLTFFFAIRRSSGGSFFDRVFVFDPLDMNLAG